MYVNMFILQNLLLKKKLERRAPFFESVADK